MRGWQASTIAHNGPHTHTSTFSRQAFARVVQFRLRPLKEEGAGKAGCALHPRSHVPESACFGAHEHTGSAETLRPSPRNGFTSYTCSPWRPGFLVTITRVMRSIIASLDRKSTRL